MPRNHHWHFVMAARLALAALVLSGCAAPAASPTAVPATAVPTTAPTSAPTVAPASATPMPSPTVDVSTAMDTFLTKAQKTGFAGSVLVARNGQVLLSKGYGLANAAQNVPNTPQTEFRLGSVTKQFTAMAILMLATQGKLDLHAFVCQYLANCPTQWQAITLHQLLTHTSGIPDYLGLGDFSAIQATPTPLTQTEALFRDLPLDFTPGSTYEYSSSNYFVLGEVIEQVSGQSYGDFLRQHIFEPLGMANSGYTPPPAGLAMGYVSFSTPADAFDASVGFSAGSLYSTVEDLYRWDQALYTESLVPRAALQQMFSPYVDTGDPGPSYYGYGWVITTDQGHRLYDHVGGISGFRTEIARYVDDHLVIIVLSNEEATDPDSIRQILADKVLHP